MTPLEACNAITELLTGLGLDPPVIGEPPHVAYPKMYRAVAAMAPYYSPTDLHRRYWERT